MKLVVIDGQGGRIGKTLIEELRKKDNNIEIWAIGTNSIATSTMLKAGATYGATGENPVIVNSYDADIIVGPLGIVVADALFGEVTSKMAVAVGKSKAEKFLLPVNKCRNHVVGMPEYNLNDLIVEVIKSIISIINI